MAPELSTETGERPTVPLTGRLSVRLLLLTIVFVLLAEVMIFLPSLANFRLRWLEERLTGAAAVSVVLLALDSDGQLPASAHREALAAIGAEAVAVRDAGESHLLVVSEIPVSVDEHVDLDANAGPGEMLRALDTLLRGGERRIRAFGRVAGDERVFELVIGDRALRAAMLAYARNFALVSLVISIFAATLVYYTINRMLVRPIRDMTSAILRFSAAPDDQASIIAPRNSQDEISVAMRELSAMQARLQRMLAERKHLADLGLAVSKINHDMRNMLSSVQLLSDRLAVTRDPSVQSILPKLLRAIDRAVSYTQGVLAYGRTQEPPPSRRRLRLRMLVEEVRDLFGLEDEGKVEFVNAVPADFEVDADSEQLFRVLNNLCRNAVQAMVADQDAAVVRRLTVAAAREGGVARITVEDTGPGLPAVARENLFTAFRGAARSGGTGLGLAIAHELVRAHGGTIELTESRGGRTVFTITIPDQPVQLDSLRGERRRPA